MTLLQRSTFISLFKSIIKLLWITNKKPKEKIVIKLLQQFNFLNMHEVQSARKNRDTSNCLPKPLLAFYGWNGSAIISGHEDGFSFICYMKKRKILNFAWKLEIYLNSLKLWHSNDPHPLGYKFSQFLHFVREFACWSGLMDRRLQCTKPLKQ